MKIQPTEDLPQHKPSEFYFRQALEDARTLSECRMIGRQAVRELERIREQARACGLDPDIQFILSTEAEDKGLSRFAFSLTSSDANLTKLKAE